MIMVCSQSTWVKEIAKMNVYGVKCKAERVSIRISVVQGKILQLKKCETVEA